MNILSIESSCDDSAIAYTNLHTSKLLWHEKISQEYAHSIYGGVVPEIASRLFANDLPKLLDTFKKKFSFNDISYIAVTYEPGLSTSLLEGIMMAKALSISLSIPLIGINHLKGHIYSLFIDNKNEVFPLSVLLVSGGHTMIIECYSYNDMYIISHTLDDSFGECYDKAAKMLGLGYPGGMLLDNIAQTAQKENIKKLDLPIPIKNQNTLNFSFSGLKNAFRLNLKDQKELIEVIDEINMLQLEYKNKINQNKFDKLKSNDSKINRLLEYIQNHNYTKSLVYGLQDSATTHLIQKCNKYLNHNRNIKNFAIVGGASANSMLRYKIQNLCNKFDLQLYKSDLAYCSDNAAMIGRAAIGKINSNNFIKDNILNLDISPRNTELKHKKQK